MNCSPEHYTVAATSTEPKTPSGKGMKVKIKRNKNTPGKTEQPSVSKPESAVGGKTDCASGSANKQDIVKPSAFNNTTNTGNGNSSNPHDANSNNTNSGSSQSCNNATKMATGGGPFEYLKQAIAREQEQSNKAKALNSSKTELTKDKSRSELNSSPGSASFNNMFKTTSHVLVGGMTSSDSKPTSSKAQKNDPYEFNENENRLGMPGSSGTKKLKSEKDRCDMRDMTTDTCHLSVMTDPDCFGPCEPGTSVVLEGIVWQETENAGLLVVNVTWRGKTYVGTLLDATKHEWAPPSFRSDSPQDPEARTPRTVRGKRGRTTMNSMGGRGTGTRTTRNSACSNGSSNSNPPASPAKSTTGNTVTEKRKAESELENPNTPIKKPKLDVSVSNEPTVRTKAIMEDTWYVCSHPDCSKKYKNVDGLKYHQRSAHKDLLLYLEKQSELEQQPDQCSEEIASKDKRKKPKRSKNRQPSQPQPQCDTVAPSVEAVSPGSNNSGASPCDKWSSQSAAVASPDAKPSFPPVIPVTAVKTVSAPIVNVPRPDEPMDISKDDKKKERKEKKKRKKEKRKEKLMMEQQTSGVAKASCSNASQKSDVLDNNDNSNSAHSLQVQTPQDKVLGATVLEGPFAHVAMPSAAPLLPYSPPKASASPLPQSQGQPFDKRQGNKHLSQTNRRDPCNMVESLRSPAAYSDISEEGNDNDTAPTLENEVELANNQANSPKDNTGDGLPKALQQEPPNLTPVITHTAHTKGAPSSLTAQPLLAKDLSVKPHTSTKPHHSSHPGQTPDASRQHQESTSGNRESSKPHHPEDAHQIKTIPASQTNTTQFSSFSPGLPFSPMSTHMKSDVMTSIHPTAQHSPPQQQLSQDNQRMARPLVDDRARRPEGFNSNSSQSKPQSKPERTDRSPAADISRRIPESSHQTQPSKVPSNQPHAMSSNPTGVDGNKYSTHKLNPTGSDYPGHKQFPNEMGYLSDRQNENQKILKENIELKSQMTEKERDMRLQDHMKQQGYPRDIARENQARDLAYQAQVRDAHAREREKAASVAKMNDNNRKPVSTETKLPPSVPSSSRPPLLPPQGPASGVKMDSSPLHSPKTKAELKQGVSDRKEPPMTSQMSHHRDESRHSQEKRTSDQLLERSDSRPASRKSPNPTPPSMMSSGGLPGHYAYYHPHMLQAMPNPMYQLPPGYPYMPGFLHSAADMKALEMLHHASLASQFKPQTGPHDLRKIDRRSPLLPEGDRSAKPQMLDRLTSPGSSMPRSSAQLPANPWHYSNGGTHPVMQQSPPSSSKH